MNALRGKKSYKSMIPILTSISTIKVNYSRERTQNGIAKYPLADSKELGSIPALPINIWLTAVKSFFASLI